MALKLNKVELDITKEVINISLSKAADSLSFFIKEKVMIQLLDIEIDAPLYNPISRRDNSAKNYLLTTHIEGDIGGVAYLIFNESEVEKLVELNLPDSIKKDPVKRESMTEAIFLEMDNIITASVVTQFSNILQRKMYGGVPHLDILKQSELNYFLNNKSSKLLNAMYINSRFLTKEVEINPEFIWLMDDTFFLNVKNIVSDEKKIELLRKMSTVE